MNVESEQHDTAPPSRQRSTRPSSPAPGGGEPMDIEGEGNTNHKATPPPASNTPTAAATGAAAAGGGGEGPLDAPAFSIDVCFEASKLPLDVAIVNSVRAAGGDEKIRKYLQAVLVVGGTALIPGLAHALESRCASLSH
jgi:actin-related protein 8